MVYRLIDASDDEDPVLVRAGIEALLARSGIPAGDVPWLAEEIISLKPVVRGTRPQPDATPPELVAGLVTQQFNAYRQDGRDVGLVAVLLFACEWTIHHGGVLAPPAPEEGEELDGDLAGAEPGDAFPAPVVVAEEDDEDRIYIERLRTLLPRWLDPVRGIDFNAAVKPLAGWSKPCGVSFLLREGKLVELGRVDPLRQIDLKALHGALWSPGAYTADKPHTLAFWLDLLGARVLEVIRRALEAEPLVTLGALAEGVLNQLEGWMRDRADRKDYESGLLPLLDVLERRLAEQTSDDARHLGSYWRLALRVDAASRLEEERRRRIADSAQNALGRLRARLRSTPTDEATLDALGLDLLHYKRGADVLAWIRGLWPALKVLLLAMRALPVTGVTSDLRYWHELHEQNDQPPATWYLVPQFASGVVHGFARYEQKEHPDLRELREAFADWCLERIETKDRHSAESRKDATPRHGRLANEQFVEPSPVWRACFVRAARELRVNPRGKGHRRLEWLAKYDPDETVRQEAAAAAEVLRHGPSLPEGISPRRPIFGALWQLRQAHYLAPGGELREGVEINEIGAKRTRQKEVQRSKEVEETESVN